MLFSAGGPHQYSGHGVVGQPALSLHEKNVSRAEEDGGGDSGQAGAAYQEDGRLAQTDGEQRSPEILFTVICVACRVEMRTTRNYTFN